MKLILFFLFLKVSFISAGEWKLIDDTTLYFNGKIEYNELSTFLDFYRESVDKIILNSKGGETLAALRIANKLKGQIKVVEVSEICASSCANYLFVIGEKKYINKNSVVGYHGNVTSTMADWEDLKQRLLEQGISKEEINKYENNFNMQMDLEKEFYNSLGISQDLFDRSNLLDKGMGDGNRYKLLLPTSETFSKYGISNVYGTQDINFSLENNCIID